MAPAERRVCPFTVMLMRVPPNATESQVAEALLRFGELAPGGIKFHRQGAKFKQRRGHARARTHGASPLPHCPALPLCRRLPPRASHSTPSVFVRPWRRRRCSTARLPSSANPCRSIRPACGAVPQDPTRPPARDARHAGRRRSAALPRLGLSRAWGWRRASRSNGGARLGGTAGVPGAAGVAGGDSGGGVPGAAGLAGRRAAVCRGRRSASPASSTWRRSCSAARPLQAQLAALTTPADPLVSGVQMLMAEISKSRVGLAALSPRCSTLQVLYAEQTRNLLESQPLHEMFETILTKFCEARDSSFVSTSRNCSTSACSRCASASAARCSSR